MMLTQLQVAAPEVVGISGVAVAIALGAFAAMGAIVRAAFKAIDDSRREFLEHQDKLTLALEKVIHSLQEVELSLERLNGRRRA